MIRLKNESQIGKIRESCKALSQMYRELAPLVKPGVTGVEIDQWVREWIKKIGGKPAFLGYKPAKIPPFPAALCISINNGVIHGIPSKRKIRDGDLVSLDSGIDMGGFISDQAVSVEAGKVSPAVHELSVHTRECLEIGIAQAVQGNRIHQIGRAVEAHAKQFGYGVVSEYCGHGVGFDLHEDPSVTNAPHGGPNPRIHSGLVIAIEPMINLGTGSVDVLDDDWSVVTADGKVSAHWEHTVAILNGKTEVLTEMPF
jgi:methionyl aminopeptidase